MKTKALLITISALLALTSCTPKDLTSSEIKVTIDGKPIGSEIIFSHLSGEKVILDMTTCAQWQVSEKPVWLDIAPAKGVGSQKITVTVNRDNTGAAPLNDKITFLLINGVKSTIKVRQDGDAYAVFKADATPRWESGTTVEKSENTNHIFITDVDVKLFSSAKYKTGRITVADGSQYEIIEFNGPASVGKPTGAALRKPSTGSVPLHSFEIVKMEGGKLWMVFKETASAQERRVVQ